jgi:hypothetical protein
MDTKLNLKELIVEVLSSSNCPVTLNSEMRLEIAQLCENEMFASNRDEFDKKISNIVQSLVREKMLRE